MTDDATDPDNLPNGSGEGDTSSTGPDTSSGGAPEQPDTEQEPEPAQPPAESPTESPTEGARATTQSPMEGGHPGEGSSGGEQSAE
jgi:hypothetical protein